MRYARPTRHYRVAEKQVQQNPYKGTFIPNSDKTKLGILLPVLVLYYLF